MNNTQKLFRNFIIIIVVILLIITGFIVVNIIEKRKQEQEIIQSEIDTDALNQYYYNGNYYVQNSDIQTILCVGLDSYNNEISDSYRNNELADCIVLLVLDKTNKTVLPIQINRDTMCNYHVLGIGGKITNDSFGQIALSHSYGSGDITSLVNVKDAVSNLLCNIRIDNYISVTMNAVAKINDKAGGVKVYVEDDFSSIDPSLVQGEEVLLLGDHALNFVRARQGLDDSSNINRLNRQRIYLRALYDVCAEKVNVDEGFVRDCLESISDYLIANTNIYGLSDMGNTLLEYDLLDAVQLKGEAKKGEEYMEFYPDESILEEFCINNFYKKVK